MNYLVHPQTLLFNTKTISGFNEMVEAELVPQWILLELAQDVAEQWTEMWDEDQGFGSSDGTYMIKELIDSVIMYVKNGNQKLEYRTNFNPNLRVEKYGNTNS